MSLMYTKYVTQSNPLGKGGSVIFKNFRVQLAPFTISVYNLFTWVILRQQDLTKSVDQSLSLNIP